jgi:hypothetical protein
MKAKPKRPWEAFPEDAPLDKKYTVRLNDNLKSKARYLAGVRGERSPQSLFESLINELATADIEQREGSQKAS